MIKITSKQNNFRRCGMTHPAEAVEYPDDKFTKEQVAILQAEPLLIVEVITDEAEDISTLTVTQLLAEISKYQPTKMLKGVRQIQLVDILKAHREKQGG
jgi:hypothetical protein